MMLKKNGWVIRLVCFLFVISCSNTKLAAAARMSFGAYHITLNKKLSKLQVDLIKLVRQSIHEIINAPENGHIRDILSEHSISYRDMNKSDIQVQGQKKLHMMLVSFGFVPQKKRVADCIGKQIVDVLNAQRMNRDSFQASINRKNPFVILQSTIALTVDIDPIWKAISNDIKEKVAEICNVKDRKHFFRDALQYPHISLLKIFIIQRGHPKEKFYAKKLLDMKDARDNRYVGDKIDHIVTTFISREGFKAEELDPLLLDPLSLIKVDYSDRFDENGIGVDEYKNVNSFIFDGDHWSTESESKEHREISSPASPASPFEPFVPFRSTSPWDYSSPISEKSISPEEPWQISTPSPSSAFSAFTPFRPISPIPSSPGSPARLISPAAAAAASPSLYPLPARSASPERFPSPAAPSPSPERKSSADTAGSYPMREWQYPWSLMPHPLMYRSPETADYIKGLPKGFEHDSEK